MQKNEGISSVRDGAILDGLSLAPPEYPNPSCQLTAAAREIPHKMSRRTLS